MNVLNEGRSARRGAGVLGGCLLASIAAWVVIFVVAYLVWSAVS